jgi:hypothetical protein
MIINLSKGQSINLITQWICLLAIVSFSSCQSFKKDSFLNNLESFVNEVDLKCENYDEVDWEVEDKKYDNFIEIKYPEFKGAMTGAEISKANTLFGKYQALKFKSGIRSLKSEFEDIIEQGQSMINEVLKDSVK